MSYQVSEFLVEHNKLYANLISNDKKMKINLPIEDKVNLSSLPNKYGCVTNAHVINDQGIGIYEPRRYRPFVPLPEGFRQCKQWEFDRHCAQNPDPRYPIDINALVWKVFNQENNSISKFKLKNPLDPTGSE